MSSSKVSVIYATVLTRFNRALQNMYHTTGLQSEIARDKTSVEDHYIQVLISWRISMEFGYNEAQQKVRESTVEFVQKKINPQLLSPPDPAKFDRGLWKACAEQGLFSHGMPEPWNSNAHGGLLTMVMALESFGYACDDNGLP